LLSGHMMCVQRSSSRLTESSPYCQN
jgi:hypothetical protein